MLTVVIIKMALLVVFVLQSNGIYVAYLDRWCI